MQQKRTTFDKQAAWMAAGSVMIPHFNIGRSKPALDEHVLGHGKYKYRAHTLSGAFGYRPVIHHKNLFAGVCWSRLKYLNRTPESGFVTILEENNKVISNPGGTKPEYHNGQLLVMLQETPVFKHCLDVCIDEDENIYVCQ